MVELVDTLSWGGSGLSLVGVRVPPSAPLKSNFTSISIPSRPTFFGPSLKFVKKRFLKTLRSHLRSQFWSHCQRSKQRQKASRVSAHLSLPQALFPHLFLSLLHSTGSAQSLWRQTRIQSIVGKQIQDSLSTSSLLSTLHRSRHLCPNSLWRNSDDCWGDQGSSAHWTGEELSLHQAHSAAHQPLQQRASISSDCGPRGKEVQSFGLLC